MFAEIQNKLKECLEAILNESGNVANPAQIAGGSINHAFSFEYAGRKYFVKINEAEVFPAMLEKEAAGLKLLFGEKSLVVPEVIAHATSGGLQFLVLSFLEKAAENETYWQQLGNGLAKLHRQTSLSFGLEYDNYIGSLEQRNSPQSAFSEFFVLNRIEPLLGKAIDERYFDKNIARNFERFFRRLNELFPSEKPALLHGDLWSGNVMSTMLGPAVIDPAVYYGHRESDIAMTKLFGEFHPSFYERYQDAFPMEKGWNSRVDLFNLYPLLVHVNLFGGSYVSSVKEIISRF